MLSHQHTMHVHHSPPRGPPGGNRTALEAPPGDPAPVGRAQRAGPYPQGAPYPAGDVWGGKIGRSTREAVVPGAFARAHALERHLGSFGSVSCGWNTKGGFKHGGQALQLARASPHGRPAPLSPPQGTLPPLSIRSTNKDKSTGAKSLPLPAHRCAGLRPEDGRRPWCRQETCTQLYLPLRLNPLEMPTQLKPRGGEPSPRPCVKCPWGQGWAHTE